MLDNIGILIQELYETKRNLINLPENENKRWSFTLDGNLIGDIGELIVCHHFDLIPLSKGEKTHDAKTKEGRKVQIKTTQGERVGLGLKQRDFDYLIVVKIENNGAYRIIYNGPGNTIWNETNSLSISTKKLESIDKTINEKNKLKIVRSMDIT